MPCSRFIATAPPANVHRCFFTRQGKDIQIKDVNLHIKRKFSFSQGRNFSCVSVETTLVRKKKNPFLQVLLLVLIRRTLIFRKDNSEKEKTKSISLIDAIYI